MNIGPVKGLAGIVALVLLAGTVGHAKQSPSIVADVRAAIARQDFALGDGILAAASCVFTIRAG